jgi:hypothetical protein
MGLLELPFYSFQRVSYVFPNLPVCVGRAYALPQHIGAHQPRDECNGPYNAKVHQGQDRSRVDVRQGTGERHPSFVCRGTESLH